MHFIVPYSQETPVALSSFIRGKGISLTQWRKIKLKGIILVNDEPAFPYTVLKAGDHVQIIYTSESKVVPTDIPISIVYEDDYVLVVDKPAGMLVHPAQGELTHSLANAVMNYYSLNNCNLGFHPVLRLDRNTSGLVLIAKQPHIQHILSSKPLITKHYYAIVSGCPEPKEGLIDAPIARHPNSIIERIVHPNGQPALTQYTTLACFNDASLIEVELLTGRTHQIRVHFSHIGHPLLGDDLYGGSRDLINRQALHASSLCFLHPVSSKKVHICSPLPDDLKKLVAFLSNKS